MEGEKGAMCAEGLDALGDLSVDWSKNRSEHI
jgi:hypothetical protein